MKRTISTLTIFFSIMFCYQLLAISQSLEYGPDGSRIEDPANPILDIVPGSSADTTTAAFGVPNPVLKNDFNIFFNPSQIMNYGTAYGEVWNSGQVWGGSTIRLPGDFKVGIFLGRPYTGKAGNYFTSAGNIGGGMTSPTFGGIGNQTSVGTPTLGGIGNLNPLNPINHVDVLVGKKLVDDLSLGLKFTYADDSDETVLESTSTNQVNNNGTMDNTRHTSDHHITLGVVWNNFILFSSIDISADMGLASLKNEYKESQVTNKRFADYKVEGDNKPSWTFTIRPILDLGENKLVTVLNLNLIDMSSKFDNKVDINGDGVFTNVGDKNSSGTFKDTETLAVALLAFHTRPSQSLLIIYSAGFSSDKRTIEAVGVTHGTNDYKESETMTTTYVPIAISLEHQLFPWFKTRFGVSKQLFYNEKAEFKDDEGRPYTHTVKENTKALTLFPYINVSLGIGLVPAKDFEIDLALTATTYTFEAMVSRASLRYHF